MIDSNRAHVVQESRPACMLNVGEVAAVLKCSTRTVYRLADAGRIPAPCRLGTLVRWNAAAIEAWIAAGCPTCRHAERRKKTSGIGKEFP